MRNNIIANLLLFATTRISSNMREYVNLSLRLCWLWLIRGILLFIYIERVHNPARAVVPDRTVNAKRTNYTHGQWPCWSAGNTDTLFNKPGNTCGANCEKGKVATPLITCQIPDSCTRGIAILHYLYPYPMCVFVTPVIRCQNWAFYCLLDLKERQK